MSAPSKHVARSQVEQAGKREDPRECEPIRPATTRPAGAAAVRFPLPIDELPVSLPGDLVPTVARLASLLNLIDSLPWPAILVNESGEVTHVNAQMRERGARLEGRADLHVRSLFPEYYNALQGERPWLVSQDADVVMISGDIPVREKLWLRKLDAGAVMIIVDQTRLQELEIGYAQNARLASMGFLLASIAHEIGSPLSVISSAAQILQSKRGVARSDSGLTYQAVLEGDTITAPLTLRTESYELLGDGEIAIDRYTSVEFAALENEHLWQNVWQMACRVEHIPNVGDYVQYEVADLSLIVVRTAPEVVKAFHNSCRHRGTSLVEADAIPRSSSAHSMDLPGVSTAPFEACPQLGTSPTQCQKTSSCQRRPLHSGKASFSSILAIIRSRSSCSATR